MNGVLLPEEADKDEHAEGLPLSLHARTRSKGGHWMGVLSQPGALDQTVSLQDGLRHRFTYFVVGCLPVALLAGGRAVVNAAAATATIPGASVAAEVALPVQISPRYLVGKLRNA